MNVESERRIREIRNFGAQYHSRAGSQPVHSSSLLFCVRFNVVVTKHAVTLDTGPRQCFICRAETGFGAGEDQDRAWYLAVKRPRQYRNSPCRTNDVPIAASARDRCCQKSKMLQPVQSTDVLGVRQSSRRRRRILLLGRSEWHTGSCGVFSRVGRRNFRSPFEVRLDADRLGEHASEMVGGWRRGGFSFRLAREVKKVDNDQRVQRNGKAIRVDVKKEIGEDCQ